MIEWYFVSYQNKWKTEGPADNWTRGPSGLWVIHAFGAFETKLLRCRVMHPIVYVQHKLRTWVTATACGQAVWMPKPGIESSLRSPLLLAWYEVPLDRKLGLIPDFGLNFLTPHSYRDSCTYFMLYVYSTVHHSISGQCRSERTKSVYDSQVRCASDSDIRPAFSSPLLLIRYEIPLDDMRVWSSVIS